MQPEEIKATRNSVSILLKSCFEAIKGPGDLICKFCAGQIGSRGSLYESDKFSRCYNKRLPLHFFTEQLEAHALNNYMRGPGHYPRKA